MAWTLRVWIEHLCDGAEWSQTSLFVLLYWQAFSWVGAPHIRLIGSRRHLCARILLRSFDESGTFHFEKESRQHEGDAWLEGAAIYKPAVCAWGRAQLLASVCQSDRSYSFFFHCRKIRWRHIPSPANLPLYRTQHTCRLGTSRRHPRWPLQTPRLRCRGKNMSSLEISLPS